MRERVCQQLSRIFPIFFDVPLLDNIVAVLIIGQDISHSLLDLGKPPSTIHMPRSCYPDLVGILSVIFFPILRELKKVSMFLLIEATNDRTITVRGKTNFSRGKRKTFSNVSHVNDLSLFLTILNSTIRNRVCQLKSTRNPRKISII